MFSRTENRITLSSTGSATGTKKRKIPRSFAVLAALAFLLPQVASAGVSISSGGSSGSVCSQSSVLINLSASGVGNATSGFFVTWYRNGATYQAYNMGCVGAPACTTSLSVPTTAPGAYSARVTYTFLDLLRGTYETRNMFSNTINVDFSPTGSAQAEFSIDGQTGSILSLCQNAPLRIDGTASSCVSNYLVSVQQSDPWWNRFGTEAYRWLTSAEAANIGNFDTRSFAASGGVTMTPGNYYRVKLAVSDPWDSDTKLVYLRPAQTSFRINGSASNQINVGNNDPMILDGADSTCASGYFISIQESDAFWNRFGPEHMRWLSAAEAANIGGFDLRNFLSSFGATFDLNKYYRVKLAVGNPWHSQTRLVYIN